MRRKSSACIAALIAASVMLTGCELNIGNKDSAETSADTEALAGNDVNPGAEQAAESDTTGTAANESETESEGGEDTGSAEEEEEYEMPSPVCFLKNTVSYKNGSIVTGEKDVVKISPTSLVSFGLSQEDVQGLSDSIDMVMKINDASFENAYDELADAAGNESNSSWLPYYMTSKVSIPRADSVVTSIVIMNSSFSGGAHGMASVDTYSFDSQTGNELKVDDVFKDTSKLPKMIKDSIDSSVDLSADEDYFRNAIKNDEIEFIIDNAGLTFFFNPTDVAPYADGIVTASIPFFNNEDMFVKKFTNTMPSYAAHIVAGAPYNDYVVDANKIDSLYVYSNSGKAGSPITSISVNCGKYSDEQEIDKAQYVEYTYFETVDYGRFLYAEATGTDGAMVTYIWKIETDGSGIAFVDKKENTCAPMYSDAIDGVNYFELLTHPEEMVMENAGRVEHYFIGEDGSPAREARDEE